MNLSKREAERLFDESQRLVAIFYRELEKSNETGSTLPGLWAFGQLLGRNSETVGELDDMLEAIRSAALRTMEAVEAVDS